MDRVSTAVRSRIMSKVKTRDTLPEMQIRRIIHGLGYRYSLHKEGLPGKPDIVFVSRRKVIFVHGCFWHGHKCRYGRPPKSKLEYWKPKIARNKERDKEQMKILRKDGWCIMEVWQCHMRNPELLKNRIVEFLEDE
jgi:DNA mismatch endonuclease, patch repair protein